MNHAERHNRVGIATATPTPRMLMYNDASVVTLNEKPFKAILM
jgi:hypothetical protein